MSSLVIIGPVVLQKKIFRFRQCISRFHNYILFEKGVALYFNRFESPFLKDALCMPSLVEIGRVVLEKEMKM